ncbi:MAG: aldo/keto reductase [Kiritimatiellia bacterium]
MGSEWCVTRRRAIGGAVAAGLCLGAGEACATEEVFTGRPRVRPLKSDGKTPIPLLGLGCAERFPLKTRAGAGAADAAYAERMIDFALRHGVNWLDTGYAYHKGASEPFLGRVLRKYPRESFLLSTKLPTWQVKTFDDAKRIFEDQLARCQVDYFDFYLLHSISRKAEFERVYVKLGVLDYLLEQKKAGRIRHLGMSYHGKSDYLGELLDAYPGLFEVCMVMQNAMEFTWNKDAANLAATAAARGVSVLVMEPLAGGRAAGLRGEALEIIKSARPHDSAARWGFRFAASLPGVACVFSGMGKLEYLKENIETLSENFQPLTDAERKTYEAAIAAYMKHPSIPCTGCSYCVPCPYGVRIPELFAWYNEWAQNGRLPADEGPNDSQDLRRRFLASYYNTFRARERADRCLACRKCLVPCPQWTFRIPTEMEKVAGIVARTEAAYVKKGGTIR